MVSVGLVLARAALRLVEAAVLCKAKLCELMEPWPKLMTLEVLLPSYCKVTSPATLRWPPWLKAIWPAAVAVPFTRSVLSSTRSPLWACSSLFVARLTAILLLLSSACRSELLRSTEAEVWAGAGAGAGVEAAVPTLSEV